MTSATRFWAAAGSAIATAASRTASHNEMTERQTPAGRRHVGRDKVRREIVRRDMANPLVRAPWWRASGAAISAVPRRCAWDLPQPAPRCRRCGKLPNLGIPVGPRAGIDDARRRVVDGLAQAVHADVVEE